MNTSLEAVKHREEKAERFVLQQQHISSTASAAGISIPMIQHSVHSPTKHALCIGETIPIIAGLVLRGW